MPYFEKKQYFKEIKGISQSESMKSLENQVVVITGARGLIGSELIDTIMYANNNNSLRCKIYAVVRNIEVTKDRFKNHMSSEWFHLVQADINKDEVLVDEDIDIFIHGASNTHPIYYSTKPIETILTNTLGTNNTLKFALEHHCKRYIFLSSVEVYGENRGDVDAFSEDYCGYIDCNTLRAGYPEGKRAAESLCQAYRKEYGIEIVIPRLARCYGPGLLQEDSKALSQFIRKGLAKEDIILKSEGKQFYSYLYVADAVDAIVFMLDKGVDGEAYNVVGENSNISLKELAQLIADLCGTNVAFDLPGEQEQAGYSTATKAVLVDKKLRKLGWNSNYSLHRGIQDTLLLLK